MANSNPRTAIAALALPAVTGAEQVLIPAGAFDAPDGAMAGSGPWALSDTEGAALAARIRARGRDLPIDYEHQTLLAANNGQPAPAAGWVSAAEVRWQQGVGITAPVHWTERAAAMIGAGEYRFLSPVFRYSPATDERPGTPTALLHLALTNTPALPTLPEVRLAAASRYPLDPPDPETPMKKTFQQSVAAALSQPETATDTELLAALAVSLNDAADKIAALSADKTALDEQIAALKSGSAPADVVQDLQQQIAALKSQQLQREVDDLVDAALADGRVLPAMEQWARDLGTADLAALTSYLDKAAPIAALKGTQTGGAAPVGADGKPAPSPEEQAVMAAMGLSADEYAKGKPA
jgi:phage I-like protein